MKLGSAGEAFFVETSNEPITELDKVAEGPILSDDGETDHAEDEKGGEYMNSEQLRDDS